MTYLTLLLLTALFVYKYREKSLYAVFVVSYTQNFIVPFLFTHGYVSKEVARALVLAKDFLLLELFVWSLVVLVKRLHRPLPRPLLPLALLTAYCVFRFGVGVALFDDDLISGLYKLKIIVFPLEILVVVMTLTALKPDFGRRFLRDITYILSALAVVAIVLAFWAPADFWVENANVAELQTDVKGNSDIGMYLDQGLPANATMTSGREMLMSFLSFRASGTFGEGIALAFSMSLPVLLLSLYFSKNIISVLALSATSSALLFSLTRSAWIFCVFVAIYVLIRRGRYSLLAIVGGTIVTLLLFWPPLNEFVGNTITHIAPSSNNPDSEHAEGILWFYARGFSDLRNILGKGMRDEVQEIPESGYAYLLEHFGLVAYLSFLWFCFSLYWQFRKDSAEGNEALMTVAQGIALGILIIMHFSQYPFSMPSFMSLWYVVGLCLGGSVLPNKGLPSSPVVLSNPPLSLQPV
jgi:hypothetical protein